MTRPAEDYTLAQQRLHWLSALLILAMFPMGLVMARTEAADVRAALYAAHLIDGVVIAVLSAIRMVLARRRPVAPPPGLPRWNEALNGAVHALALLVPLVLALSGAAALIANGLMPAVLQPGVTIPAVLEDVRAQTAHRLLAYGYLALLGVHVVGVMRYQFTKGDVMRRMGVWGFPGVSTATGRKTRGGSQA